MRYLDLPRLRAADARGFREAHPYPWTNPFGLLTASGYEALRRDLPDAALFTPTFAKKRKYGQRSHDRLTLEYAPDLPLPPSWRDFVAELQGREYRTFLHRMLGRRWLRLRFHWHYTPAGCSVSPHCDARRKLGSHIFYLNDEDDWDPEWGGQTLVLDDEGRLSPRSAPELEQFRAEMPSQSLGNHSLLFMRRGNSWHAVREVRCPPGVYRKVFIVVIETALPGWSVSLPAPRLLRDRRGA